MLTHGTMCFGIKTKNHHILGSCIFVLELSMNFLNGSLTGGISLACTEIFPKHVIESFEYFKQKFDIGEDPFPLSLHYCSKISMSWIFSWKYEMSKIDETSKLFPVLQRVPYSRWWDKFDTRRVDKPAIDQWFNDNPKYLCQTEQSKFLNQRSRITSLLSSTTDKAALMNHLTTFLLALQDNPGSSSQAQHTTPTEETVPEEEDYVVDLDED